MDLQTAFHDPSLPATDGTTPVGHEHDPGAVLVNSGNDQNGHSIVEGEGGQNPIDFIPVILHPCPPPPIPLAFHDSVNLDGDDNGGGGSGGGGSDPAPAPAPEPAPPAPEPYGPTGSIGGMGNLDRQEGTPPSGNSAEPQDPHLRWLRKRVLEASI